jgi:hypothetical protein
VGELDARELALKEAEPEQQQQRHAIAQSGLSREQERSLKAWRIMRAASASFKALMPSPTSPGGARDVGPCEQTPPGSRATPEWLNQILEGRRRPASAPVPVHWHGAWGVARADAWDRVRPSSDQRSWLRSISFVTSPICSAMTGSIAAALRVSRSICASRAGAFGSGSVLPAASAAPRAVWSRARTAGSFRET